MPSGRPLVFPVCAEVILRKTEIICSSVMKCRVGSKKEKEGYRGTTFARVIPILINA